MIPQKIQTNAKKDFLLLLAVSALFLGYFFFSGRSKPNPRQDPVTIDTLRPDLVVNIATNVEFPELPAALDVYKASVRNEDLQEMGQELATFMKFSRIGTTGWANLVKDEAVLINPSPLSLVYLVDGNERPSAYEGSDKPSFDPARKAATDFVKRIFPDGRFKLEADNITYLVGNQEFESGDSSNYDYIKFEFTETVNGYPLRSYNTPVAPIGILVGQKNQVVKFTYYPQSVSYDPDSAVSQSLYSHDEITHLLKKKAFKVVEVDAYPAIPLTASELVRLNVETVSLEYRFEGQELKPSLFVLGTAVSENGTTARVLIILPATKTP